MIETFVRLRLIATDLASVEIATGRLLLSIVSLCILIAEFWTGIVVIGWQGDRLFLDRSKTPGPYWMMMTLHTIVGAGLPILAFIAGI